MAVKANNTHDLSFLKQDGTTEVGLMLAEDSKGFKVYEEIDDTTQSNQYYSGEAGFANLAPDREVQIAQFEFHAGAGQEYFDPYDSKRYFESRNADLRFKGNALAGSSSGSITIPSGIARAWVEYQDDLYVSSDSKLCRMNGMGDRFGSIKDLSENITDIKEYIDGNLYIALGDGNKYYYMDKAELVVHNCEVAWDEYVDDDVAATADNTSGKVMNGTYSAKFDVTSDCEAGDILATDSMTSTDLSGYTDISLWVYSSVALSSGDFQLLLDDTASCESPLETLNIPAVSASTWTMVNMSFATPGNLTAVISIGIKMVNDKGAFNLWVDDIRASSFIQSDLSDGDADLFCLVDDTMRKATSHNELKSSTDPSNAGSWTTATTVGSDSDDITSLLTESGQLFIPKEDMPYYMDTDGEVHQLIPELKNIRASTNGVNSIVWNKKLYMPYGNGLIEYDSGTVTWRSPSKYLASLTAFGTRVYVLAGDEEYLYAIFRYSSYNYLLAGREENIDGIDRWVWHTLSFWSSTSSPQIMFISSVYKKRLYVTYSGTGTTIGYFPVPNNYVDVVRDADYTFVSDGYFVTPWYAVDFAGDDKAFIKITLTMDSTDSNDYWECHYQKLDDSAWTDIGDFKTSPTTEKYLPVDASSNKPVSTMIRFKFVAKVDNTAASPKLLGFDCRGIWYPTKRRLVNCRIKVADNLIMKKGGTDNQTASDIKDAIDEANEDATWPITFYDINGSTMYVKILSAEYHLVEVGKERSKEWVYDLVLEKVALS